MEIDEDVLNQFMCNLIGKNKKNNVNMKISGELRKLLEDMQKDIKENYGIDVPLTKVTELLAMEIRVIKRNDMVKKENKKWDFNLF